MKHLSNVKWLALALSMVLALSLFAGCDFAKHADENLDHACDDGCGEVYGKHIDVDLDHVCDYGCSESIGKCADVDKNHVCDYGCFKAYGEHSDADKDHACDDGCKEAIGSCADENKDHACDYGCSKVYGEHADADKDHVCDYGCSEAFGECVDENKDHACDYGCSKVYGEHKDENKDHACDYGCSEAIGECVDENKDHVCDYGCDKVNGEHADGNKDHVCDYGCKVAIGTCEDADKDHDCDYGCKKTYGNHVDENSDHTCDYGCKVAIGEHKDGNSDHTCDYGCKVAIGTCEDADKDHNCDYGCKKAYGDHVDENKDHTCDYGCKVTIGECVDSDYDHKCDHGCDKAYGNHVDETKDHICDYGCKVAIGEHKDDNTDHICDYGCKESIGTHEAAENSHNCAYCNVAITTCEGNYNEGVITTDPTCTAKGVKTYTCQICGATKTEEVDANGHKDDDSDLRCDVCTALLCTEHVAGEIKVENNVEPTCSKEGSYDNVVYCTKCGEQMSKETITVNKIDHTSSAVVVENEVDATCESAGSYDNVVYCSVCKIELDRSSVTVNAKGHVDANGDLACDNNCGKNYYVLTLEGATANADTTSAVANAYLEGTEITVTADAYKNVDGVKYMFVGFDKNTVDNRVGDLGNPKYTFNMPAESFTLTAAYAEANTKLFIDGEKNFTISSSATTANWVATKLENSTDADLEGLSGWSFMIPNNAQGSTTSTTTNLPARNISTWGLDQNQLIKVIFKNYGNYDLVFEVTGEYFKDLWRSGYIDVPANSVTVAYMSMGTFLGKSGTTDMALKLRNNLDGDGSESFQLDVVASSAKQFVSRFDENLVSIGDGKYMDFGEPSEDADSDGVMESHPIRDGYGAAKSSSMSMTNYDSVGAMHFWGDYETTTANAYARIRGDKLAGEEINLKTIATAGEKLVIYVKVTNLNTIAGKYTLGFTRGSGDLSTNFIGQQNIVFTGTENESFVYRIEIDPASVGATSTNLQLGLIKKAADGSSGKISVLIQIASENIFGEDPVN